MPTELTRKASLPMQTRALTGTPVSYDAEAGTIEVVWTTGARVRRRDAWTGIEYDEELVVSPQAIDMSRFDAKAVQVLDAHSIYGGVGAILGVAERAWISGNEGRAVLRLSQRQEVAGIVGDIAAGIIRPVSVGYSVESYEVVPPEQRQDGETRPLYRAVRWTLLEISFVSIPADIGAGTRSAASTVYPCEYRESSTRSTPTEHITMNEPVAAPRAAIDNEIRALVQRHQLPATLADDMIARDCSFDVASNTVIAELAIRDRAAGGHLNVAGGLARGATNPSHMIEALTARMLGTVAPDANPYRFATVRDLARECLELRGVRTGDLSPAKLIERALHATSDFPELLQGSGQRALRQAYMAYQGGLKRICKASTARDFRAKQMLKGGEFPALLKTSEAGEFKYGSTAEAKSSYKLLTYGRIFGITRQALINDDLDAFGTMANNIGRAAADLEAKTLVELLTSNPTMYDGTALFHADHGNLASGGGSALSETALTTARAAMRLQKGLDGATPIDATPAYLVVPAALETAGEKLIATLQPTQSADVNPFAGKLELVVDPRLDAVSATAWYLAASAATIDTIEYSYLESAQGPEIIIQDGFDVDGLQMKGRLDFGAGAIEWRGLYKAAGA